MNAIAEVNLAGTWSFTPENGPAAVIQVPGGGWLKQGFDCEAGVYQRRITIPDTGAPQAVRLELGAVNHHAIYSIGADENSLRPIHDEVTAFTPQSVDLTPYVQPGGSYLLLIAVRAYRDGRPIAPHWAEWSECVARGIFRDAWLRAYPAVFISDVFVTTSVAERAFAATVWVTNTTGAPRCVSISGALSAWNKAAWPYPDFPDIALTVAPHSISEARLDPVTWTPGPESYWRPNLPYQSGYRAQLHTLNLALIRDGVPLHAADVRFGFRELRQEGDHFTLNGVRINFRGDNLQVANYDRVDNGGKGDAIDTLPGFLPPTAENPGWPQAVDNFLRLNYNVQRCHMGPWTPYMLDVCDEMGLMLFGESAARWNGFDMEDGRAPHEVKCMEDIVRRDRNHPSIVRWSSKNEAQSVEPEYHLELYQAIKALDPTRPIYEDIVIGNRQEYDPARVYAPLLDMPDFTWIEHYITYRDDGSVYFTPFEHNDAVIPLKGRPYGLGEANWLRSSMPAGLTWFATTTVLARLQGASDVRPYVLLSSWASSIPGVNTTDFYTEEERRPVYGEDNFPDPWRDPGIRLLQTACHPLLACDAEFWQLNRRGDDLGHFPVHTPSVVAGAEITREITLFNDDLTGEDLLVRWELREGSPSNWVFASGSRVLSVPVGTRTTIPVTFLAPEFNTQVYLILCVSKDGAARFHDDRTCYTVANGKQFDRELSLALRQKTLVSSSPA